MTTPILLATLSGLKLLHWRAFSNIVQLGLEVIIIHPKKIIPQAQ